MTENTRKDDLQGQGLLRVGREEVHPLEGIQTGIMIPTDLPPEKDVPLERSLPENHQRKKEEIIRFQEI